jgi:hypothetical protein
VCTDDLTVSIKFTNVVLRMHVTARNVKANFPENIK